MGKTVIPEHTKWVCDSCGITSDHKSDYKPSHWADLRIYRDSYDHGGAAVASGDVERVLCQDCGNDVVSTINDVCDTRRAKRDNDGR